MSANFASTNDISIPTARVMADSLRKGSKISVILCALQSARVSKETLAYSNLRHHLKRCALHPMYGGIVHELLKRFTAILEKKEDPINVAIEKQLGIKKENDDYEDIEEMDENDLVENEEENEKKSSASTISDLFGLSPKKNNIVTKLTEKKKKRKEKEISVVKSGRVLKKCSPLKLIQSAYDKTEYRLAKKSEKRLAKKETSKLPTWDELF